MTDRRHFIGLVSTSAVGLAVTRNVATAAAAEPVSANKKYPVRFALNMSTLRGQNLTVKEQVEVAAKAGYDGVEPWIRDLETHVKNGGSIADLRKQIEDAGMTVESAIGFAQWINDDDEQRKAGLETARRDMELVRSIGGTRIAAPPIGAHQKDAVSPPLEVIAKRYRALLEVGDETGVTPQLELWGFSPTISTLGELAYVATAAEHPKACVLPDFYHIYKGGSDFAGLGMIEASRMHCFHINDYPGEPSQRDISDKDRVFPGDGVCPLVPTIRLLLDHGFRGTFSLELFNPEYWKRDALEVAREGLEKSKQVVADAIAQA
ncbi:sugar phosphate isomerase/epimerase family protein [Novipirellula sp. SH528]|uniref:sugar phosphate isomerase/epimerase family protein n=1 Tax=Novipirellula sp. SH528 TaxID=3454466 RepID=UPI003FA0955B